MRFQFVSGLLIGLAAAAPADEKRQAPTAISTVARKSLPQWGIAQGDTDSRRLQPL